MVKLRILEILEEQGHTKYWLYKRMDMMSYSLKKSRGQGAGSPPLESIAKGVFS